MKNRGKIWKIALALLLLGGIAALCLWAFLPAPSASGEKIETVTVEKRLVDNIMEVSGHLKPRDEQNIMAPTAGVVAEVYVREGSKVKKGDPIARMEASEQEFAIRQLEYQLEQTRFEGSVRKSRLLEDELAFKKKAAEELTIKAHLNGTVSRLAMKPGDVLKQGEAYGRVIDVSSLCADVEISEMDIPRVRKGLPATFSFPALPGLSVSGTILSFASEARVGDNGITVLDAKLEISLPPAELLSAYSFSASIVLGESEEALVVDSRAVSYERGKPSVNLKKPDGLWETVPVVTEGFGSGFLRIRSGVKEGDILKIETDLKLAPS